MHSEWALNGVQLTDCRARLYSEPPCFRLVKGEGDETEEVTCRVAGIVCSKVLPPMVGPL